MESICQSFTLPKYDIVSGRFASRKSIRWSETRLKAASVFSAFTSMTTGNNFSPLYALFNYHLDSRLYSYSMCDLSCLNHSGN